LFVIQPSSLTGHKFQGLLRSLSALPPPPGRGGRPRPQVSSRKHSPRTSTIWSRSPWVTEGWRGLRAGHPLDARETQPSNSTQTSKAVAVGGGRSRRGHLDSKYSKVYFFIFWCVVWCITWCVVGGFLRCRIYELNWGYADRYPYHGLRRPGTSKKHLEALCDEREHYLRRVERTRDPLVRQATPSPPPAWCPGRGRPGTSGRGETCG